MAERLVVDISEKTQKGERLVLRHIFYGQTREAALAIFEAHKKADSFLSECIEKGVYAGKVSCSAKTYWI